MGGFPQSRQCKQQGESFSALYGLVSEVTYQHFCCILLVKSVRPDLMVAWSLQGGDLDIGFYKE